MIRDFRTDRNQIRCSVYTIPDSSCATPKTYHIGLSFTHNANFGSIFVSERCCDASVLKVNRRYIAIGFRDTFLSCVNSREVNNEERGLNSSGKMVAVLGHFCSHQAGVFSPRHKMLYIVPD